MIDNAPTSAKALAKLEPMTIMTMATIMETNKMVWVKDCE